jgi:hypothetical protein
MARHAGRESSPYVAEFNEVAGSFLPSPRDARIARARALRRPMDGNIGQLFLGQALDDRHHLLVYARAVLVIVKLLVDGESRLTGNVRELCV